MAADNPVDELNTIITRLIEENKQTRLKIERPKITMRLRAPETEELSLYGAVTVILDERDNARERIYLFRNELKKVLTILATTKNSSDAAREINVFLFNNPV